MKLDMLLQPEIIEVVIINLLIIRKFLERGRQLCHYAVPYESDAML